MTEKNKIYCKKLSFKNIVAGGSSITFSGQTTDEPIFLPRGQLVVSLLGISNATIPVGVVWKKLITRDSDGYVVPCKLTLISFFFNLNNLTI